MLLQEKNGQKEFKKSILFSTALVIVVFTIILFRLGYLQLIQGEKFKTLSENNRIRIRRVPDPRGIILDRKGSVLVYNYPSFDLSIISEDVPKLQEVIENLSQLLNIPIESIREKLDKSKGHPPFRPIKLKTDLNRTDIAIIETNRQDLPGITIEIEPKRFYLYDSLASHIIGYMGKISKSQLKREAYADYSILNTVGKHGIEYEFEKLLRGKDGGRRIEVDAAGREVRLLSEIKPVPGNNIFLSIDLEIQKIVEKLLTGRRGCAIVMDPNNGDILALASRPFFNPNLFSPGISTKEWEELINDPDRPMENKAIQGQYPPASVYKIITAIAALQERIITPETVLRCEGSYLFGKRNYRCWKRTGHGNVTLHKALVESCDIYFYQLGQKLGIDRLASYSKGFGLGEPTTVSLLNEKPGLVPTKQWKLRVLNSRWQKGETLSTSIGQGFLLVTPIQVINLISAIANGGILYRPQIVKRIEAQDGTIIREFSPEKLRTIPADGKVIKIITDALCAAVNEPNGTGRRAKITEISVAGKSGTAQVIGLPQDNARSAAHDDTLFRLRDHAWFAAFAPSYRPRISVVVMIEHGGSGGSTAAPIAKGIIEESLKFLSSKEPIFVQLDDPE